MRGMLPVLRVHACEQEPAAPVSALRGQSRASPALLYCSSKGVEATGYESTQRFVVKAVSQAVNAVTASFSQMVGATELRADLLKNEVLVTEWPSCGSHRTMCSQRLRPRRTSCWAAVPMAAFSGKTRRVGP